MHFLFPLGTLQSLKNFKRANTSRVGVPQKKLQYHFKHEGKEEIVFGGHGLLKGELTLFIMVKGTIPGLAKFTA